MEKWLAEEKERTLQKVAEYFVNKKSWADGGDKSKRKAVDCVCSCSKSKKPKISKIKRKVDDDRDSKGAIISKPKVSVIKRKTDPKFKTPLDWSYFETASDLEVLGMRRLQNELLDRGLSCKDTTTLQRRAAKLFHYKLDFPDPNLWCYGV